jgi:hypothetical protein
VRTAAVSCSSGVTYSLVPIGAQSGPRTSLAIVSPRPVVAPATTRAYTSRLSAALVCPSVPITAAGLAPAANARAQNVRRRSWQLARAIDGLPVFTRASFARASAGRRTCRAMLERAFSRPVLVANTRSFGPVKRERIRWTFNISTSSGFRSAISRRVAEQEQTIKRLSDQLEVARSELAACQRARRQERQAAARERKEALLAEVAKRKPKKVTA